MVHWLLTAWSCITVGRSCWKLWILAALCICVHIRVCIFELCMWRLCLRHKLSEWGHLESIQNQDQIHISLNLWWSFWKSLWKIGKLSAYQLQTRVEMWKEGRIIVRSSVDWNEPMLGCFNIGLGQIWSFSWLNQLLVSTVWPNHGSPYSRLSSPSVWAKSMGSTWKAPFGRYSYRFSASQWR